MVDPPVPLVPVFGEADQRVGEQRALGEVGRAGEVGAHPGLGLGGRVVRGAQVEVVQRPAAAGARLLAGRAVRAGDDDGAQCLGLVDRLPQRVLEPGLVERAGDLDGVTGVVDRAVGVE